MSLNKTQLDALIDRNCKSNTVSYPVADKTADENLALDYIYSKIFEVDGIWQFDDSNHTDYPIITTNLVQGQRDYSFVSDENGNLILDIFKVMVKDVSGIYYEIYPVDVQSQSGTEGFYDGENTQSTPFRYDKTANGIFLDSVPSYDSASGLKIYINREGSYFTEQDTTKKAGFAGLYHEYLALRPSYQYAYRNSLPNVALLRDEMLKMEEQILNHYQKRSRDEKKIIRPVYRSPL